MGSIQANRFFCHVDQGKKQQQLRCQLHKAWFSLLNVNVPRKQRVTACAQEPAVGDPGPQRSLLPAGRPAGIMFVKDPAAGQERPRLVAIRFGKKPPFIDHHYGH